MAEPAENAVPPADAKKAKAKGKDKEKDKGKEKGRKKGAKAAGGERLSVATHPQARDHVRRVKGWAGLAGFVLAAVLSWRAGVPGFDLGIRALLAGVAGYLVGWGCAVGAWRAILVAELHARVERAQAPPSPPADTR